MGRKSNRQKLNRAQKDARSKIQKQSSVILELHRYAEFFTKNDIEDWRHAWQSAIDPRHPSRQKLYDIYRDAMTDSHLSGCIQQRVGFVMSRSVKLVNVIPEKGRVVQRRGMNWETGIEYRERPWRDWLIEAGRPDDLGLLLKAALHTIPKKHAMTFWDCFAEVFGMPWRIARTTTRDPKEFQRLQDMIYNGGANQGVVTGMETEIQFVESGKGDAFNVYDKRIDRANSELSKLVIGQTMTIEDGSSLSQSQTHLQVFMNLVESDRDFLRDIINNQLIPLMILHGFPVKGLRFEWNDAVDYTPEQQVAYETMIADRYEVDSSYFADKYNMPVGKRINQMSLPPAGDGDKGDSDTTDSNGKEKKIFFD